MRGHVDDVAVGAVGGDAMSRHDGGETAEREAGYFGPAVANSPRMDELHQRITELVTRMGALRIRYALIDRRDPELVTRMGALDGAMRHMAAIIAEQERRILSLEALVGASPIEIALTHLPTPMVAQTTGHADDRR